MEAEMAAAETETHNMHRPAADWERQGGVFCGQRHLKIIALYIDTYNSL